MIIYRKNKNVNFKHARGKNGVLGRMFHDYYEIFLLLNGDVEFISDRIRQKITPLQLVVIPAGEYHQFVIEEAINSYERCVLEIYPDFLPHNILENAFSGKHIITLRENDRITEHFLYLMRCLTSVDEYDFSHILDAVTADIIFLIKNNLNTAEPSNANISTLSLNVMDYINRHFEQNPELDILSQKFYCSVSTICHVFKKDFGISIKKYILSKRINAAKMAIQQGGKPEEVSIKYGFSNYSTFYRDYKKYLGISPSETLRRTDKESK